MSFHNFKCLQQVLGMQFIFILLVLIALSQAIPSYDLERQEWSTFKAEYGKMYYDAMEDEWRFETYLKNKAMIARHNQLYAEGHTTYSLAENQFSDMLPFEYETVLPPLNETQMEEESTDYNYLDYIDSELPVLPSSVDWSKKGAVTGVKSQGACGSCWAFSATGAVEGRHFRSSHKLVSLSEQNLLDCSSKYGPKGCHGGWPHDAFRYIVANKGIEKETTYPYKGVQGRCHYNRGNSGATIKSYKRVRKGSEEALTHAVVAQGPISVVIDAGHNSIRFYKNGVVNEPKCKANMLTHAVLLVGYGHDPKYGDYWLIKNSWGPAYGDKGYFKLARNKSNMCGIASVATYPTV